MKRTIIVIALAMITISGCNQHSEQPKGAVVYPGGVVMKTPEEIRQLEEMTKQAPGNGQAWIALGNALMDSNRYGEGANAYEKALAIDPKNVDVRVDRGTCLKNSGKPNEAVEEFRKAAEINPNHLFAHRNMGVVLAYDLKDKKAAIKEFEKYLELAPNAQDAADIRNMVQELKAAK